MADRRAVIGFGGFFLGREVPEGRQHVANADATHEDLPPLSVSSGTVGGANAVPWAMAGATAELLLPDDSDAPLAAWAEIVAALSTRVQGRDFWIAPQAGEADAEGELPFFWSANRPNHDSPWSLDDVPGGIATVHATFGFTPRMSIHLGAICRGRPSDRILARLAAAFLEQREGALLFDGLLAPSLDPAEWRSWYAMAHDACALAFSACVAGHPGVLVAIPEDEPAFHAADAAFLEYWRAHPTFHFVN